MTRARSDYIRISGGRVLTCDSENREFVRGEVWISGGRIAAIGDDGGWAPGQENASVETVEAGGRIVMPGLVNAHAHSYSALLKGTVDALPLDLYMLHVIATSSNRSEREIYVSTLIDCLSMLKTGVTSVIDHFSHRPEMSLEAIMAALTAYRDSGMRAVVAPMFADLPYGQTVPLGGNDKASTGAGGPDPESYFAVIEETQTRLPAFGDRFALLLGVDGPQRCSPKLLDMTGDFVRRHGIGLHTHLLESKTQALMAPEGGFVRRMVELGMLNENSSLIHFVWCTDDDIAAAKEAGVTVVHAPTSNLQLGSGICPLHKLRDAGIPLAIGTDGSNCGSPNMFEKLRSAAALARVTEPDFERWVTASGMFRMAQSGGARALGLAGSAGLLAEGAVADILVLDPAKHIHRPMGDVWNHLLYYENGTSVEHVFVDGVQAVRDGRVVLFDEEAILAEGEELVARAREKGGGGDGIAGQYERYRDMVVAAMSSIDPDDRLARLR